MKRGRGGMSRGEERENGRRWMLERWEGQERDWNGRWKRRRKTGPYSFRKIRREKKEKRECKGRKKGGNKKNTLSYISFLDKEEAER